MKKDQDINRLSFKRLGFEPEDLGYDPQENILNRDEQHAENKNSGSTRPNIGIDVG